MRHFRGVGEGGQVVVICGGGIGGGGGTHELVRDDHIFCVFVGALNMHLARCRLFMGKPMILCCLSHPYSLT